jgi:hypothetical protein
MKSAIGLGLLASALVSFASTKGAEAANGDTWWSANAATCVPTPSSSSHTVSAGTVQVSSGTVTLYCPITYSAALDGLSLFTLHLSHKGSKKNTITEKAYVQAELVVMSRSTGAESVPSGATFNPGGSTTYVEDSSGNITHAFDFNANYYYMRITIPCNTITAGFDQTFYGVAIVESAG